MSLKDEKSARTLGELMSLGRERPPSKITPEERDLTEKFSIEKQRRSSSTIISETLRGSTMKKVLWGQNKMPICK